MKVFILLLFTLCIICITSGIKVEYRMKAMNNFYTEKKFRYYGLNYLDGGYAAEFKKSLSDSIYSAEEKVVLADAYKLLLRTDHTTYYTYLKTWGKNHRIDVYHLMQVLLDEYKDTVLQFIITDIKYKEAFEYICKDISLMVQKGNLVFTPIQEIELLKILTELMLNNRISSIVYYSENKDAAIFDLTVTARNNMVAFLLQHQSASSLMKSKTLSLFKSLFDAIKIKVTDADKLNSLTNGSIYDKYVKTN